MELCLCQSIWSVWSSQTLICAKEEKPMVKMGSQRINNTRNTVGHTSKLTLADRHSQPRTPEARTGIWSHVRLAT